MTSETARNIATVIAATAAVLSLPQLFRNLRLSERSLRSKVYFDVLELMEGKDGEVRDLRHVLEKELLRAKQESRMFDILSADQGLQQKLDQLARAYDKVGLLVKHGVVPSEFLFDFYSCPILVAWSTIWPLIDRVRKDRVQKSHMLKFEILAIGAALYREKKYGAKPEFSISIEDKAKWNKWKRWKTEWWFTKPRA